MQKCFQLLNSIIAIIISSILIFSLHLQFLYIAAKSAIDPFIGSYNQQCNAILRWSYVFRHIWMCTHLFVSLSGNFNSKTTEFRTIKHRKLNAYRYDDLCNAEVVQLKLKEIVAIWICIEICSAFCNRLNFHFKMLAH